MSADRKPPASSSRQPSSAESSSPPASPSPLPRSSPAATPSPPSAPPPDPNNPDEIRADIAVTRQDLGDTVEALAAKADVKSLSKEAAAEAKARVRDKAAVARGRARDTTHAATEHGPWGTSEVTDSLRRHRAASIAAVAVGVLAVAGTVVVIRRWTGGHAEKRRRHTRWAERALRPGAGLASAVLK